MKMSSKKYIGIGSVPVGIGAMLMGWDITEEHYRDLGKFTIVNFRAMTEACPHDCFHCFTDKNKKTLTLSEIKNIIDELAILKTSAIDFVGEGEPTIDSDFFEIIEYTSKKGIVPVIYTDAALKLRDTEFCNRVFQSGACVVPKCDSLFSEEYQNWVVGDKTRQYFRQRNEAIDLLIKIGFNNPDDEGRTRLGFDMVLSKRNKDEVERTLRFCREKNIWIIFTYYLPSGRSGAEDFDNSLTLTEEDKAIVRKTIKRVDKEFGFEHPIWNNLGTMRCIEFFQIFGDGRVTACVANDDVIGNIKDMSAVELQKAILEKYPFHNRLYHDGHCPYKVICPLE
jgi:MoaA/NifB/PqqE/SkfB family radical SAM enzyme